MRLQKYRRDPGLVAYRWWRGTEWDNKLFLNLEIAWRTKFTMVGFKFGGDDRDFTLYLGLYFVTFWLSIGNFFSRKYRRASYQKSQERGREVKKYAHEIDPFEGRDTGIRIHHGSVWLSFWDDKMSWSGDDNKKWPWNGGGWTATLKVRNWIIGSPTYKERESTTVDAMVDMPEGQYPAKVKLYQCRWWRKGGLLFFLPSPRKWLNRATVEVEDGIPIPGKGTMSYNCEDTSFYSLTCPVSDGPTAADDACLSLALAVTAHRIKYAGDNWEPEEGCWPPHCEQW